MIDRNDTVACRPNPLVSFARLVSLSTSNCWPRSDMQHGKIAPKKSETHQQHVACVFVDLAGLGVSEQWFSSMAQVQAEIATKVRAGRRTYAIACSYVQADGNGREISKMVRRSNLGTKKARISLDVIAYMSQQSPRGASHAICVFVT